MAGERIRLLRPDNLKKGVKVAALVGVGAVAARVGGRMAARLSTTVANFAVKGAYQAAAVEFGAGLLLDAALLLVVAKVAKKGALAASMAPFLIGGTAAGSLGPALMGKAVDAVDGVFSRLPGMKQNVIAPIQSLPATGGLYAELSSGALASELPGGTYADVSMGLGGDLPSPGGVYPTRMGSRFIGGDLP